MLSELYSPFDTLIDFQSLESIFQFNFFNIDLMSNSFKTFHMLLVLKLTSVDSFFHIHIGLGGNGPLLAFHEYIKSTTCP